MGNTRWAGQHQVLHTLAHVGRQPRAGLALRARAPALCAGTESRRRHSAEPAKRARSAGTNKPRVASTHPERMSNQHERLDLRASVQGVRGWALSVAASAGAAHPHFLPPALDCVHKECLCLLRLRGKGVSDVGGRGAHRGSPPRHGMGGGRTAPPPASPVRRPESDRTESPSSVAQGSEGMGARWRSRPRTDGRDAASSHHGPEPVTRAVPMDEHQCGAAVWRHHLWVRSQRAVHLGQSGATLHRVRTQRRGRHGDGAQPSHYCARVRLHGPAPQQLVLRLRQTLARRRPPQAQRRHQRNAGHHHGRGERGTCRGMTVSAAKPKRRAESGGARTSSALADGSRGPEQGQLEHHERGGREHNAHAPNRAPSAVFLPNGEREQRQCHE